MLYFCTECHHVFYGDLQECPNCHKVNLTPLAVSETVVTAEQSVQRTAFAAFSGGVIFGMFVIYVLVALLNGSR